MTISIITPFFNVVSTLGANALSRLCHSLSGQTGLKNFRGRVEHVWIDDGSTDTTYNALHEMSRVNRHLNITLLRSSTNHGPGAARNQAIRTARGKWITYLDSDDLLSCNRISSLRPILVQRHNLYFAPYHINAPGGERVYDLRQRLAVNQISLQPLAELENVSVPLGVAHTKELWESVGGFPEDLVCGEDGVLWRRMLNRANARVGFLNEVAGTYFVRSESQSRTKRRFAAGSALELNTAHPGGANGQYLDPV